jgi:hypothetical protein
VRKKSFFSFISKGSPQKSVPLIKVTIRLVTDAARVTQLGRYKTIVGTYRVVSAPVKHINTTLKYN